MDYVYVGTESNPKKYKLVYWQRMANNGNRSWCRAGQEITLARLKENKMYAYWSEVKEVNVKFSLGLDFLGEEARLFDMIGEGTGEKVYFEREEDLIWVVDEPYIDSKTQKETTRKAVHLWLRFLCKKV